MRYTVEERKDRIALDGILDDEEQMEIELQDRPGGTMVYVHIDGVTILRIHSHKDVTVKMPTPGE